MSASTGCGHCVARGYVGEVPQRDVSSLFDHLVGESEQLIMHGEAERFPGLLSGSRLARPLG
jgi:hypothetical protein